MNEILNYRKLIGITNKLILNKRNSFEIHCIAFFHVIKGSEYHFKNYRFLFNKSKFILLKCICISFLSFFKFFTKKIFNKKSKYNNSLFLDHEFDYLFVSHLVNETYLNKRVDFQFGKVPFVHKKTGMVYFNHISNFDYSKNLNLLKKFPVPIYILENKTNLCNYFKIILSVFKQSFKIFKLIKFDLNLLEIKLIIFGLIKSFSSSTLYNYVMMLEFFLLIKRTKPKFLIFTFEGQSYERVIIYAAKLADPRIKIIGYQNSPLIKNQNTLLLKFDSKFMPDEVWTSGYFCSKIVKKKLKIRTKILGSPKYISRKQVNNYAFFNNNSKKITCLVAPEGTLSETFMLFNFCLIYLNTYNNINFLFRLHPEINKNKLFSKFNTFNQNFTKVKFTKNKNDDFMTSDLILYRGTTLVTQAIKFGLRPLYLSLGKNDLNVDPLYNYHHIWKKIIYNHHDLNTASFEKFTNSKKIIFTRKLQGFSETILQKIDYRVIKGLK